MATAQRYNGPSDDQADDHDQQLEERYQQDPHGPQHWKPDSEIPEEGHGPVKPRRPNPHADKQAECHGPPQCKRHPGQLFAVEGSDQTAEEHPKKNPVNDHDTRSKGRIWKRNQLYPALRQQRKDVRQSHFIGSAPGHEGLFANMPRLV